MTQLAPTQLAAFSVDVYDAATELSRQLPPGFIRLAGLSGEAGIGGLYAAAYLNQATGELVIAYRAGSELRDLFTNLSAVSSTGDTHLNRALAFVEEARAYAAANGIAVPDAAITLTGHGAGGGFASLVSVATGLQAFTFDGLHIGGLMSAMEERFGTRIAPDYANRIRNYVSAGGDSYTAPRGTARVGDVIDVEASALSSFGQLQTALAGRTSGNDLLDSIHDWLATDDDDRRRAQRMMMALELQFGAVDLVDVAAGSQAAAGADAALLGSLNRLMQTDRADLIAARSFDRLLIDGSDFGNAQDASSYGASDDLIVGATGADVLLGGSGDDVLFGGDGLDILAGGSGDDYLIGGAGADVYRFTGADGVDTIADRQGANRIVVGDRPLAPIFAAAGAGEWVSVDGSARLLQDAGTRIMLAGGGELRLDGFEVGDFSIALRGALADPLTHGTTAGTTFDDYLDGTMGNDRMEAGAGSDYVFGYAGDDYVDGGDGDDYMVGDGDGAPGRDLLVGGAGSDVLLGEAGDDRLYATGIVALADAVRETASAATSGRGDWLGGGQGDDVLIGSTAADVLLGGGGRDILVGGSGSDFLLGDAEYAPADTEWVFRIEANGRPNYAIEQPQLADSPTGAQDVLYGGAGDDWISGGRGDDFLYGDNGRDRMMGDAGSDTLWGGDDADELSGGSGRQVDLGDFGEEYLDGGAGDDLLFGSAGGGFLDGGAGDDLIFAGPGADRIFGGAGNDRIFAQGQDVVDGGDGDDQISVFGADAVVAHGGDGNDQVSGDLGDDALYGDAGDDVLIGDEGDDLLDGGTGNDRYVVRAGAGVDSVRDAGGIDVLEIRSSTGEGEVARESIRLVADNSEVYLEYGAQGDRVRLGADPRGLIERIELHRSSSAGDSVESFDLSSLQVHYAGTGDAEILFGVEGFLNSLAGGAGNDILLGSSLDDVLAGGAGQDLLRGGDGSDRYLLGAGGGIDTIVDDGAAGTDIVAVAAAKADARLGLAGGALLVSFGATDAVQIRGFNPLDALASTAIERFTFADGELSYQQLLARGFDLAGSDDADVITGTSLADRFQGRKGDDRLAGGKGNDEYRFGRGDGRDFVSDGDPTAGNLDRVVFSDVNSGEIDVESGFDRLSLKVRGTTDRVDIQWSPGEGYQVEEIEFADGVVWGLDKLKSLFGTGNRNPGVNRPVVDQFVLEDAPFSLQLAADMFVDPDAGEALTLSASRAGGGALPDWLRFDATTRTFSGTPANGDVGVVSVTVTATDGAGATAADTFDLSVANVNDAPELVQSIGRRVAIEDSAFGFTIPAGTFRDVDAGDAITYVATLDRGAALPGWLQFDGATGRFSGTPGNDDVQTLRVQVFAVDGAGAMAGDVFELAVENTNDAPELAAPIADLRSREGEPFEFAVPAGTFVDRDKDDTLAYEATLANGDPLPAWLQFDRTAGAFTGTPGRMEVGAYTIRLTARDGDDVSASDEFVLTVEAVPGTVQIGNDGDNILVGGAGDDTLDGRRGADMLSGGAGDDTLIYSRDAVWSGNLRRVNAGSPGVAGTGEAATLNGRSRSYDLFDGGSGLDTLIGTGAGDAILLDDPLSAPFAGVARLAGIETILAGGGADLVDLTSARFGYGGVLIDAGDGADIVWASAGDDVIYGGRGNDRIHAGAGDDYVSGDGGSDDLNGGEGNDIVQGGNANDRLFDLFGNNVLDGRAGSDDLFDGAGNSFIVGGRGGDRITVGGGADVLAFNRGDFRDVVRGTGNVTLSLGGGIAYQDLALRKSGVDLVVDVGAGERVTFKDWYADPQNELVKTLQVVAEAMQGYSPGADPLLGQKVKWFDFGAIVDAFDAARAANQNLGRWSMMGELLDAHLGGSDGAAIGGDLAHLYGRSGALTGLAAGAVQEVLGGAGFGTDAQSLRALDQITAGEVKLS